jgi:phosphonate transport system ATP-binding protein
VASVSLSGVSKSFSPKSKVLDAIDLTIEEGEMVALIGASGSGKSTLIRLICGLERIDKGGGRIAILGETTQEDGRRTAAIAGLRKHVGVIFQQFNLVNRLSLLTNVLVGRLGRVSGWRGTLGLFPRADKIKALQALERVGMVDYAHQRASTLSGGQQQRGAIARALTQEAKLILADEPIASLDPASAKHVMDMLRTINRQDGVTVLVSLHQIDHAFDHCDRIVALKDGRIIHSGTVDSITPGDLASLYGLEEGSFDLKPKAADAGGANDRVDGVGLSAHPEAAA